MSARVPRDVQPCRSTRSPHYSAVTLAHVSCQLHPRNPCSTTSSLLPRVPHVPQMPVLTLPSSRVHGVHTCRVQSNALCTPAVPHICSSCSLHRDFGSSTPTGAIRQCRTARSGQVQTWHRSVPCSPVSIAVVCRQAVLTRSWCKPVTAAHTAIHQLFLARSCCAIQPTKPPRTAMCGQQLLLRVALASAPLLHTHLHSTICTVTGPGPEPCCASSCSHWGGGADSALSPSFTRLLPLQAVSSGEDVGSM